MTAKNARRIIGKEQIEKMGVRGPAPKPDAVKKMEGNPGKRPLKSSENEPKILDAVQKPPKWLLKEGKTAWKKLAQTLTASGILTDVSFDAFAETCQWYAYYKIATREMLKNGEKGIYQMQVSESGYESPAPIVTQVRTYYKEWRSSAKEFGLTPSSWARLMSLGNGGAGMTDEEDEMEAMLD